MVKSTTLSKFQQDMQAERDSDTLANRTVESTVSGTPSPLAQLAERMVRERTPAMTDDEIAEQLQALGVLETVDPHMALGEIKGRVREAAEAAGILAPYDLISAEAERIWTHYGDTRRASEATYSVGTDGLVDGYRATISANGKTAELGTPEAREVAAGAIQAAFDGMPNKPLGVPKDAEFGPDGWLDSGALAQRAKLLIESREPVEHLSGVSVAYLWKRQGGKSYGRPIMGRAVKVGGLLKHFSASVWVIWLAADNIRAAGYNDRGIERMLYRQMLCAGVSEVNEDTGRGGGPAFAPPEVQVHLAEIEQYGIEDPAVAEAFKQASLFAVPTPMEPAETDTAGLLKAMADRAIANGWNEREVVIVDNSAPSSDINPADLGDADDEPTYDSAQVADSAEPDPEESLTCSVCGALFDLDEFTPEDLATMRANPAVALCVECGDEGILDDGLDGEAAG